MIKWEFIKAELLKGTSVEELAQLAGTTYKNMWNRIRRYEVKDGVIYMKEEQLRPRKNRNSKRAKAPELCPVTKKPRSQEDCAECYESSCGGKGILELTVTKCNICDTCIHNLDTRCEFVSRRADFRRSGCNQYKNKDEYINELRTVETPEEKPVFLTKKFNLPEDKPRDLLPVVKAEAVPIQQTEANPEAVPEAVPELITVTKEVYGTIKYKLDCCEISIAEAREAIRHEEKNRDTWAAILERLKIEDNQEGET